jgi:hypothetical protein
LVGWVAWGWEEVVMGVVGMVEVEGVKVRVVVVRGVGGVEGAEEVEVVRGREVGDTGEPAGTVRCGRTGQRGTSHPRRRCSCQHAGHQLQASRGRQQATMSVDHIHAVTAGPDVHLFQQLTRHLQMPSIWHGGVGWSGSG